MATTVKIGEVAKEILNSFADISKKQGLRKDYLLAHGDSKIWTAIYELPEGEVELEEDIVIVNIPQFLQVVGLLDQEKNRIQLDENGVLTLQDKSKQIRYSTSPINAVQPRSKKGEEFFDQSTQITELVLDEANLDEIKKIMKTLNITNIYLQGKAGNIYFILRDDITDNEVTLKMQGASNEDFKVDLPSKQPENSFLLEYLYPGIYQVQLRKGEIQGGDLYILKFTNTSVQTGKLFYFLPL